MIISGGKMSLNTYEFLDCGKGRRLERFGAILVDRPLPYAAWNKTLPDAIWESADAYFVREKNKSFWKFSKELPESWLVSFEDIKMEMRFSENGQVGVFPEQMTNWLWLRDFLKKCKKEIKIINGFGYTGGSTLFSSFGGTLGAHTDVTHLDGSKSSVTWARKNLEHASLSDEKVRFIVDDVITFLEKEVKEEIATTDLFLILPHSVGRPAEKPGS